MANIHHSVTNDGKGNTFHDTTKNTWFDHISNKGGFKVNVMGDVGDNVKNYLINLNDISLVNLVGKPRSGFNVQMFNSGGKGLDVDEPFDNFISGDYAIKVITFKQDSYNKMTT